MSTSDQRFIDIFLLVIGLLIGISAVIFFFARYVASQTQEAYVIEDAPYQQEVVARLTPVGRVALPGEDADKEGAAAEVTAATPVAEVLSGPQAYNTACLACHGGGIGGAPTFGDKAAWSPRIAKGPDVLNDHALALMP